MDVQPQATRQPTFFIPHDGGPCFFIESPSARIWDPLANFLRALPGTLPQRPRAIVIISAHWESSQATVTGRTDPPLIYDYDGFPPETYALRYPAPGSPHLAQRIADLLRAAGITAAVDAARGFDHGMFVPLLLVEPQAMIPIV